MNNYIIFKEKNSDDFKELIICELPPISKPKMRVETTVINGRDGDILDKLGYSSYNKSVKIGLKKGYMPSLNEIIKYFSGKGKLICSNEPDKYYDAEIVEQIDYTRLVRFREAVVKFHVQPYKYKVNEAPFIFNINNEKDVKVTNIGLENSKPLITIYGSGTIDLKINDKYVCRLNIDSEYITIDAMEEEAYYNNILKNRQMLGDFPILEPGVNIISWAGTGSISKIIIEPKSRWL